jgi:hypothetical protein
MRVSGPCVGYFGPHLSTPRDSPCRSRGRSACSVMFSGCWVLQSSNVTQACLRRGRRLPGRGEDPGWAALPAPARR